MKLLPLLLAPVVAVFGAQVSGRIQYSPERPLPGANVTLTNEETGVRRVAWSNAEGFYSTAGVQPGVYKMIVRMDGFQTVARTGIRLEVEEPTGLDNLHRLVHQGCRVDGDLPAHVPGGMVQGVGHRDGSQLFLRVSSERPPAGRQHDPLDLFAPTGLNRLENGAMFAVDGQDGGVTLSGQAGHQRLDHFRLLHDSIGDDTRQAGSLRLH